MTLPEALRNFSISPLFTKTYPQPNFVARNTVKTQNNAPECQICIMNLITVLSSPVIIANDVLRFLMAKPVRLGSIFKSTVTAAAMTAALAPASTTTASAEDTSTNHTTNISVSTDDLEALRKARAMRLYSENPETQGVGIFANLAKGSIGEDYCRAAQGRLTNSKKRLHGEDAEINSECLFNITDNVGSEFTFYLGGKPYTYHLNEVMDKFDGIVAGNEDVWRHTNVKTIAFNRD